MSDEYRLGQEITRENVTWMVIRIVSNDQALVYDQDGTQFISEETYVMLKSEEGKIDFIILDHKEIPYTPSPDQKVKSSPSLWRKHANTNAS